MKKTLMIALAAGGLTIGGAAIAQDRGGDVTRADAEARAAEHFERMDLTGDGVLNAQDREARALERFNSADANGDGALTFAETQAAREARRAERQERRAERGERGQRGPRMGRRGGHGGGERMMRMADTDGDGSISRTEFMTAAMARFDRADADGDGTVTAEERRAQRAERRGQMRGERGRR
ncbi:EF-hand domain-containing protein [Aurantiacibacter sp. D1-12]|uniref:EF-hand domain-containing protein n=1 Tax=Aurantiacibacter sp. D1-12 TaxID=2993658 RepID=UPI00237CF450|nr:EF-hand domain-containing protein [Aurantiacibacter sp. D1-12]MDE1467397.1 EF-hand domain-containing protein [Aurantiacibacter sp. D1-12]